MNLILLVFIIISTISSIQDIKTFHISISLVYSGLFLQIFFSIFLYKEILLESFLGMILMPLFLLFVRILSHKKLGLGDIQFGFFCGFISRSSYFLLSCINSSIFFFIFYVFIRIFFKKYVKKVPFIPFLYLGTAASYLSFNNKDLILNWM